MSTRKGAGCPSRGNRLGGVLEAAETVWEGRPQEGKPGGEGSHGLGLKIWDIISPWAVGSLRGSLSTAAPAGAFLSHHLHPVSLPGRRGMVVVADRTSELYQKTYWASYNIPYVLLPGVSHPLPSFPCRGGVVPR